MKKILLLSFVAISMLFSNCSQPSGWSDEQRDEFLSSIAAYRNMVYLNDLNDTEFVIFSTDLTASLEESYPVYTRFVSMPSLSDTVDMWVVTTIVNELDEDGANLRHLYPYRYLVEQGILPEGLERSSRRAFYNCLASKVDNYFGSLEALFYAVITNSIEQNEITTMQQECAESIVEPVL